MYIVTEPAWLLGSKEEAIRGSNDKFMLGICYENYYDILVLCTLRLVFQSSLRFCYYSECSSHVDQHQVRPVLICLLCPTIQSIINLLFK